MCVDYTDLNKACSKDAYPYPYRVLCFLDAYLGYNQIPIPTSNMIKTAFITKDANYLQKVMPFGLKNAGVTYQRLMDKVFCH